MARPKSQVGRIWRGSPVSRQPTPVSRTSTWDAQVNDTDAVARIFDPLQSQGGETYNWLQNELSMSGMKRRQLLAMYQEMDSEYPAIASSLDLYADNITQVDMSKDSTSRGEDNIVTIISDNEKIKDLLVEVRERLHVNQRAWGTARDLVKNGDVFEEIVVSDDLKLDRLKQLPTAHVARNQDAYGVLDQRRAFLQLNESYDKVVAAFEDWEVLHYRTQRRNQDKYGTSTLHPARRTYKQLRMIEDSLVLARLTRANSRLVYMVDTGSLPPPLATEHLNKVKSEHRKRRLIDPSTGRMRDDANPLTVEEDIFMAVGKESKGRVDQLYGDLNIGNLTDVEYFQNILFGALKVPKSYLGVERDVSNRSTLTMQDIQFARSVRRIQMVLRLQYNALFELALLLEGNLKDTDLASTFHVSMPGMKTIDELREWEMMRLQAEVARIYMQELYLEPRSVLQLLLGFSQQEAEKLFQGEKSEFAKMEKNLNSAKSFKATQDKRFNDKVKEAVGPELQMLRELSEWKLEQMRLDEARARGHAG